MMEALEKFLSTRMPSVAANGICLKKHDEAIEILFDGITRWLMNLEKQFGADCFKTIIDVQFQIGLETAGQLKEKYRLRSNINGALDLMWLLIVPFGIRMRALKIGGWRIREEKTACPIFDAFRKHGVDYCEQLCISMGNGWLYAIDPNLRFELVRRGSKDCYCIKDIVDTRIKQSRV
jgi:hypothetical protein